MITEGEEGKKPAKNVLRNMRTVPKVPSIQLIMPHSIPPKFLSVSDYLVCKLL